MTRHHATAEGDVPFTPEEEAQWDAREAAAKGQPDPLLAAIEIAKIKEEAVAKVIAADPDLSSRYAEVSPSFNQGSDAQ